MHIKEHRSISVNLVLLPACPHNIKPDAGYRLTTNPNWSLTYVFLTIL